MTDPAHPLATYADIAALPEHLVGEILDGELVVTPRPTPSHAVAAGGLTADLTGPFQRGHGGPGGWWILPELALGEHIVVPDLAGWRRTRMPELPSTTPVPLRPDWVCEVLSPGTERVDRARKLRIYAGAEVGHAWLLDPRVQTLELYRREVQHGVLLDTFEGDAKVGAEPFDAVELDLGALWTTKSAG